MARMAGTRGSACRASGGKRAGAARFARSQTRRLAIACCIVACAIAAVPLSARFLTWSSSASEAIGVLGGEEPSQLARGETDDAASPELRARFEQEALPLAGRSEVRTTEDCSTVGFSMGMSTTESFSALSRELEERGWSPVASGSSTMGSFVKDGGALTWLFLNCYGIGGETCVVVNVA